VGNAETTRQAEGAQQANSNEFLNHSADSDIQDAKNAQSSGDDLPQAGNRVNVWLSKLGVLILAGMTLLGVFERKRNRD
jgi:uncharacterized surface anchored protein